MFCILFNSSMDRSFASLFPSILAVLSITLLEDKPIPYTYGNEYSIFLLSGIMNPEIRGILIILVAVYVWDSCTNNRGDPFALLIYSLYTFFLQKHVPSLFA